MSTRIEESALTHGNWFNPKTGESLYSDMDLVEVFLGAYDQEGFVVWEKDE